MTPPAFVDSPEIRLFEDLEGMSRAAIEAIKTEALLAIEERGRFTLSVSGGSTPEKMFTLLGSEACRDLLPWEKVHVFWVDERCVPPEDEASNYGTAERLWLRHVPLPGENLHRIRGEEGASDPAGEARRYEKEIRETLGTLDGEPPAFDLVFLGMGSDGHTASLFPGDPIEEGEERAVKAAGERGGHERITLTFPTLNASRRVIFLVSGSSKAPVVAEILSRAEGSERYPAAHVRPEAGPLAWFLSEGAGSSLFG